MPRARVLCADLAPHPAARRQGRRWRALTLAAALFGGACSSNGDVRGAVAVPEWQALADGLEAPDGPCCYTAGDLPDPTSPGSGAPESHLPLVSIDPDWRLTVSLAAPHPMTRGDAETAPHWITTMYVRDQNGVVLGLRDFGQNEVKPQFADRNAPSLQVLLPPGTERVRAFSFCNQHENWASDIVTP